MDNTDLLQPSSPEDTQEPEPARKCWKNMGVRVGMRLAVGKRAIRTIHSDLPRQDFTLEQQ